MGGSDFITLVLVPVAALCSPNLISPCLQLSTLSTDTGVSKEEGEEEEDDTMQNTVVLFSNTDKFVLLQVNNQPFILMSLTPVPLTRDC